MLGTSHNLNFPVKVSSLGFIDREIGSHEEQWKMNRFLNEIESESNETLSPL